MERGDGDDQRRRSPSERRNDESHNLRNLFRVADDDDNDRANASGQSDKRQSNRTLLDIIRDERTGNKDAKKSWKHFKDRLRLHRAGAAWSSTVHIPASDVPIQQNSGRTITRRHSTRFPSADVPDSDAAVSESTHDESPALSSSNYSGENRRELNSFPSNRAMMLRRNSSRITDGRLTASQNDAVESNRQAPASDESAGEAGEGRGRMSLMALLAETDRQLGLEGSSYAIDEEDEEGEEEEDIDAGTGAGGEYNNCCVCMVRHKGAAFIPCGHTFCRMCSRELWVQRGNCPLCNGYILEILDIF